MPRRTKYYITLLDLSIQMISDYLSNSYFKWHIFFGTSKFIDMEHAILLPVSMWYIDFRQLKCDIRVTKSEKFALAFPWGNKRPLLETIKAIQCSECRPTKNSPNSNWCKLIMISRPMWLPGGRMFHGNPFRGTWRLIEMEKGKRGEGKTGNGSDWEVAWTGDNLSQFSPSAGLHVPFLWVKLRATSAKGKQRRTITITKRPNGIMENSNSSTERDRDKLRERDCQTLANYANYDIFTRKLWELCSAEQRRICTNLLRQLRS